MTAAIIRNSISRIVGWYERNERWIASVSLVGGFIFDALLLKRVDEVFENIFILLHLVIAALGIIFLNVLENRKIKTKVEETTRVRLHFWTIVVVQFMFGGLLSKYLVFYFRSATLAASWPFLLILVVAFALNERMREHYARLTFQIMFLFLSTFAYAIYYVPVMFGRIGDDVFIISGLISLASTFVFIIMLRFIAHEKFIGKRLALYSSLIGMFVIINVLYFTNIIPPIPVSLKEAGVYHSVVRNGEGNYVLTEEQSSWTDYFKPYELVHVVKGKPVYVFTAVFSPTDFRMNVIHEWQYYDEAGGGWRTVTRTPLTTKGGRDNGFRTYSMKTQLSEGKWRVNVKTMRGQHIGRIKFILDYVDDNPELVEKVIK